jgi:tetratricopeptide (TPR) repeat protein
MRAWGLVVLVACGGAVKHTRTVSGGKHAHTADTLDPKANREFEAGLRALRLGGPDADDTAKGRFEAAVQADPTLWEAWHDLGVIESEAGDYDSAVDSYGKALAINPEYTPSKLGRAEAYASAGKMADAKTDLEAAIKELADDDPRRAEAAARLAALLRDAKKYDDAIDVLRDALRVQGATSQIYTALALIYLAQDREDLAQLVIARALELDAKDPAAHNALALLDLKQGKAQEAFEEFDAATSLDPDYQDARFNKASVLLDAGDYSRAKQELETVVQSKPDDYAAQVALGLAQRGLKDFKTAKTTWDKVVQHAPRRSFARSDAMWNLVVLDENFLEDNASAKKDLEQYLQDAPTSHPKRQEAEQKRKELGL